MDNVLEDHTGGEQRVLEERLTSQLSILDLDQSGS